MGLDAGQTTRVTDPLVERVAAYAGEHGLLAGEAPVLALVSGGPDSVCLMHMLARIHRGRLGVLTFDHGLRAGAAAEAAAVVSAARDLGCDAWVVRLDLSSGPAVQERARDARRAAAQDFAAEQGFALLATGHTATDQAETVLFRIARGTGRTGAIGMAPRSGGLIRPLLCLTRGETRDWCTGQGLTFADDPSNADDRFARVRVRQGLIPELMRVHPGAEHAVVRFADQLRDEAELLDALADAAWERCASGAGIDVAALAREPEALARLLVRRLLGAAGVAADARWVRSARRLAEAGGAPVQAEGGVIAVDRGVLVAEGPTPTVPGEVALQIPGRVDFGAFAVAATRAPAEPPTPSRVCVTVDARLTVRSLRPGDRLALAGGGRQAVGRLLAANGVPARHRAQVPVVADGARVVWVAGYRADPTLLAAPGRPATVLELMEAPCTRTH